MSNHPYLLQPQKAFWRKTVVNVHPLEITEWYQKKFPISDEKIATAGSCFAQHIGRNLREKGFKYIDMEPAPPALDKSKRNEFGYDLYSARYGNIYTAKQLLQLIQMAMGDFKPVETSWKKLNGFVDPFRPTIEPAPFESVEELEAHRAAHLQAVIKVVEEAQVFVFTLGLTEAWESKIDNSVFSVCPGTAGGEFDSGKYRFVNYGYNDVLNDMKDFIKLARSINPELKLILTVSPVPLAATATNNNVIVSTSYSKSVLRAAAGALYDEFDFVDYFPSYEIISSHVMRSQFYNPDMRTIASYGVKHVMEQFFKEHPVPDNQTVEKEIESESDGILCDEELLNAFGENR